MKSQDTSHADVAGSMSKPTPEFQAVMHAAHVALAQDAVDDAISQLQDALQQQPWLPAQRATLLVTLGQIIASTGNTELAAETILSSDAVLHDSPAAAHILCHDATRQIANGNYSDALKKALRAYALDGSLARVKNNILTLFTTLVPLVALRNPESDLIQEQAVFGIWRMFIKELKNKPDNSALLHTLAIWGEQAGARLAENEGQHPELLTHVNFRADEAWSCAITSWFALTADPQAWNKYIAYLDEQRQAVAISTVASEELRVEAITRLQQQIETAYEYHVTGEQMRTWHAIAPLLYIRLRFHREQQSAEALATIAAHAPHILTAVQYPGPIAGIGFLSFIGLAEYLERIVRYIATHEVAARIKQAGIQLEHCTSTLAAGYLLQQMGLIDEAILFCRSITPPRPDVRELLAQFLVEKARGLLHGDQPDEAEALCREMLHGHYLRDDAECQAIFVEIIKNRMNKHLTHHPNDWDGALHIAREAQTLVPANVALKQHCALLLRKQIASIFETSEKRFEENLAHQRQDARDYDYHGYEQDDYWQDDDEETETTSQWEPNNLTLPELRRIVALSAEVWRLDPHPSFEEPLLARILYLVVRLFDDQTLPLPVAQHEARQLVATAQTLWPQQISSVHRVQLVMLQCEISRKTAMIGAGQPLAQAVTEIAALIDAAWTIARTAHEADLTWLIRTYQRIVGKLIETTDKQLPQENGALALILLQRAFKHAPNHRALLAVKAVVLRLQAVALVVTSGLDNGKIPALPIQNQIIQLINESWVLDHSEAKVADIFASICMQMHRFDSADYFTKAALIQDPALKTAHERQKLLQIWPTYERALRSFNEGVENVNHQRPVQGLLAFTYTIHLLEPYIGRDNWDFIDDLWRQAQANAHILRRAGY